MLPFLLGSCSIARHYRTVPLSEKPVNLSDPVFDQIQPHWKPLARQLAESSGGLLPSAGNQVQVFTNGQDKFGNLLEDGMTDGGGHGVTELRKHGFSE